MATTVVRTIGTGGDYTTLQAWEDACPANLVTNDEIWRGEVLWASSSDELVVSGTALIVSGQTVDATRYMELTAAAGDSFVDNANRLTNGLRYNASNGACIRKTGGFSDAINISSNYFRLSRLQFAADDGNSYEFKIVNPGGVVENCIFGGNGRVEVQLACSSTVPTMRNVLITSSAGNFGLVITGLYQPVNLMNVTIVRPSNIGSSGTGLSLGFAENTVVRNCAVFGFSTPYSAPVINTLTNFSTDSASIQTVNTMANNLTSQTYANQFEQPSNSGGVMDFRTKAGAGLIDAGFDTSGNGVTADIVGTTRSAPYDIGAWEVASAAATPFIIVPLSQPFLEHYEVVTY